MKALKVLAVLALWLPMMVAAACVAVFVVSVGVARAVVDLFGRG
jgi:hypothetical protein